MLKWKNVFTRLSEVRTCWLIFVTVYFPSWYITYHVKYRKIFCTQSEYSMFSNFALIKSLHTLFDCVRLVQSFDFVYLKEHGLKIDVKDFWKVPFIRIIAILLRCTSFNVLYVPLLSMVNHPVKTPKKTTISCRI